MNVGDLVRLRMGGPVMIVLSGGEEAALCVWEAGSRVYRGMFHQRLLERLIHLPPAGAMH